MISRRRFLKFVCAATAACSLGTNIVSATVEPERSLNMYNIHTGETVKTVYCYAGVYDPDALAKINYLLRCHYTNEVRAIDTGVLDLLSDIREQIGTDKQLNIISGYRSPEYNSFLISSGRRVAKGSLHLRGLAIDFSIDGINNKAISGIAKSFVAGGVGLYPEFVHIDVGRVRYW